jgi:YbbR domain-containing protein
MTVRRLTVNLWWKLASVVIATILWFLIVGDPEMTMTITVPVEYRKALSDLEISSEVPQRVQLEIRGPSGKLSALQPNRVPVVLDLGSVHEPGERTFTITPDNVQLPRGVALAHAIPSQLRLNLERRIGREVPVQVRFAGPPMDGYRISSVGVFPDHVKVVGPESHVSHIEYVETDPVKLGDVVGITSARALCYVADPLVTLEDAKPVTVRVDVEKVAETKTPAN